MKTFEDIEKICGLLIMKKGFDGGIGVLFRNRKRYGTVIWSNGGGWEHVSVTPFKRNYTPTWDDMVWVKNLFFYSEEYAVELHPARHDYVNNVENCLHLWRCTSADQPIPPTWMVGVKDTVDEFDRKARKIAAEAEKYGSEELEAKMTCDKCINYERCKEINMEPFNGELEAVPVGHCVLWQEKEEY